MQKLHISSVLPRWAKDIKFKWPLKKFVPDIVVSSALKELGIIY